MASYKTTDWQCGLTLQQSNAYALEHHVACDVTFVLTSVLPPVRVEAHRYALSIRSPVFAAMLYGSLANQDEEIRVPDVHPDVFQQLLRYIYTDEANICDTSVFGLLYAADKYIIPALLDKCIPIALDNIHIDNVCETLEDSLMLGQQQLVAKCTDIIIRNAAQLFKTVSFCEASLEIVGTILDIENLGVSDLDVFEACMRWAEYKCKAEGLIPTGENKRKVLGHVFSKLCIETISLEDFTDRVMAEKVLTKKEERVLLNRLRSIEDSEEEDVPFKVRHRKQHMRQRRREIVLEPGLHGIDLAVVLEVGMRVRRGPHWYWHDEDGKPPQAGTVTSVHKVFGDDLTMAKVRWDHSSIEHEYHVDGPLNYNIQLA